VKRLLQIFLEAIEHSHFSRWWDTE